MRGRIGALIRRARAPRLRSHVESVASVLDQHLPQEAGQLVIVMLERADASFVDAVVARAPSATVQTLPLGGSRADALAALRSSRRPAAIIDATTSGNRSSLLRETVWALVDGGIYLAVAPDAAWRGLMSSLDAPRPGESPAAGRRRQELADSIELLDGPSALGLLRKRRQHHVMLRHAAVERTMHDRFGPDWGEVIVRREAYDYESQATLVMHGEPASREKPTTISVPALALRRYRDVTCHVREIATRDNLVLPDSFRHWQATRLFHKRIIPASAWFGRLEDKIAHASVRHEPGEFFTFDSAFPTHFGHMMTETISRHWGWEIARRHNPDLRVVMTHQAGRDRLPRWKAQILQALGVPLDDILWVTQEESVTVDSLIAAMPQFENPHYIDPALTETWAALFARLGDDSARDRPEKIFLSRRARSQRYCANTPEVEAFMVTQGFAVIFPEDMTFLEQVHMFRAAKIIAGFAGSALFSMMFNPGAKIIVLTSRSYVAANEYLIASAAGHQIDYFWAPALVEHPGSGFSVDAYRSGFTFPLDEHRAALISALH